jgi:hypothetical protein
MSYARMFAAILAVVSASAGLALAADGAATKPAQAQGKVEAVTVYRGQALVTRAIEIDMPAGPADLVVTDLPPGIMPDSLFVTADGTVQIRAVRYRERAVQQDPREDVRKITEAIEEVNKSVRENKSLQQALAEKKATLASMDKFAAEKTNEDMNKGTLNPTAVKDLTQFFFEQLNALAKEDLTLKENEKTLTEKLSLLERQRGELTAKLAKSAREAILFLEKGGAGKSTIRLHYLVNNATWSPIYNARCGADRKAVGLEYNALVQQMCGEDWDGVALTLSTASPSMLAEAPVLMPMWVTLAAGGVAQAAPDGGTLLLGGQKAAGEELRKALNERGQIQLSNVTVSGKGAVDQDYAVNTAANKMQFVDLVAGKDVLMAGRQGRAVDEMLSVNYALPGKISIPSRSDQQMIQIASLKLEGEFYYLGVPLLTPYVYQNADIVNTGDLALLAGPVSTYLDGQFMGGGQIPTVAKGQRFTLGFGVDTQLRVGRELADKSEKTQGGNQELTFKYRLIVENFKDKPVKVRVMDRLPDPKTPEIKLTLGEMKDPLWKNEVYERTLRKMGILIWEVDVPAKAADAKARMFEYEFKMEYDRKMRISEPTPVQVEADKQEFQKALDRFNRF